MLIGMLRHGETEANRREIVQGRSDLYGLTREGESQIIQVANRVAEMKLPFKKIYSSPARRAKETAAILSSVLGLDVEYSEALWEMDFGDLEGLSYSEVYKRQDFPVMEKNFSRYRAPGGEHAQEVQQRVLSFLEILNEDVLVVSHAIAIASVLCWIKGLSLDYVWNQSVRNGHLYLIEKKDREYRLLDELTFFSKDADGNSLVK
ncbi:MAG: hypothetical protein PWP37_1213 [Thermotogota bacterium]|nr:hypothetical protein [Thermotogota bacterium]MDK2865021.1 hypothetical protein [Thermotogota bacterium]HCZ06822.1 hypothetical protein [Thermotogota bacterium]